MLRQGQVLNGRYRIERILGQGGMGAVYLALQKDLADWVAVKEMDIQTMEPELRAAWIQQFRAEARILNRLRHSGLPRVYDYFEEDDNPCLVMDFIEGGTLWNLMAKGPVAEDHVFQWARELCDVLDYLHHHNPPVIFKDLKPNNVMLAKDGSLRLIDFGIAKVADAPGKSDTRTMLKGSVSDGYSPIEQYGQGATDMRADIYSLGATLYSLLTRKIPPPAPDRAAENDPLLPLARLRPDCSERMVSTIEWMMQVSRGARPRSMAEVVDAFGLTPHMPRTTTPARIRRLLREEFHHFFPAPTWVPRASLPVDKLAGFLKKERPGGVPAPLLGIWGAAGAGKSRLIQEVKAKLKDDVEVLPVILGNRLLRQQPFGSLLPAVRLLLRRDGGACLSAVAAGLDAQTLTEAAAGLPELRTVTPQGLYPRRSSAEMTRSLLTALVAVMDHTTKSGRAVLIVDDAQWIDPATIRFLDQMRGSPAGHRIAIILSWHPDAREEPHRAFMETWNQPAQAALVHVAPLTAPEIGTYLENLVPPIAGIEPYLPSLRELSGGNPMLLEEQIRLLVMRRVLRESNGVLRIEQWHPERMPRNLGDAVRRRLEHLPLDSQELLRQASVVGQTFTIDILKELSGEPEPVLREALQRARESAFIRWSNDLAGAYEFVCEAARQVFYDLLPADERARLHRTLGIMEEDKASVTGEITYHEVHYSLAGELDASLQHLSRLADTFLSPRSLEVVLGEMPKSKHWDAAGELSGEQEAKVLQALNMMMRAVRSKGSFGNATYVTEMAQESFAAVLLPLLEETGPISVNCAETVFNINGKTLPSNTAPADLAPMLARGRLSGFQWRPGLTRVELSNFIGLLARNREAVTDAGGWTKMLEQAAITNVTVSELVYVGVAETELFDASKLRDFTAVHLRDGRHAPSSAPRATDGDLSRVTQLLDSFQKEHLDEKAVLSRLDGIKKVLEDIRRQSIVTPLVVAEGPAPAPADP
ncbi:MAG TPA: protein kinase, partial [Candidatus Xenobia bacterium]